MSEANLRDELLKQNGGATPHAEAELKALRQLIEDDRAGARRLMRWTIGVWIGWIMCVGLSFAVFFASYAGPANGSATSQTTSPRAHGGGGGGGAVEVVAAVVGFTAFLGVPVLPIVGTVLLIVALVRRRWASHAQIRLSLASIEAQLKVLREMRSGGSTQGERKDAE